MVDTCICMAESPSSSPETIITLLIGYTDKKFKEKRKKHTAVLLLDSNWSAGSRTQCFCKTCSEPNFSLCDIPLSSLREILLFPLYHVFKTKNEERHEICVSDQCQKSEMTIASKCKK